MKLIPKGKKSYYRTLLIMTHPTARCAVLSFFLLIKFIVDYEILLRKNGVVGFIAHKYLCNKHSFCHFYLKCWARKIALKTSKNAGNSAKFEHQKLQIKIWKIMFCDTCQRQKKHYAIFQKNTICKWRLTPVSRASWGRRQTMPAMVEANEHAKTAQYHEG